MTLDDDSLYAALRARDRRFDGVFYVGVRTTGIYCRPVCPARLPRRRNCTFFRSAAEAERHGFRGCLRCRPESAPGDAAVDARSRLTRSAMSRIEAGYLNRHGVGELADSLGVTSRHLRRVLRAEVGASPTELAQTRRVAVAKQLLQDTFMPMSRVAFASGFSSIRRFNAVFRERFSRPPSSLRRKNGGSRIPAASARNDGGSRADPIVLPLEYRPPLAWSALLSFLRARATEGVEEVHGDTYRRLVVLGDAAGWVEVSRVPETSALRASVPIALASELPAVVAGLRRLFDLDARPALVADHLGDDPILGPLLAERPGLRVPGAFDPFELAVRTVLGQQISVAGASTLCGRLVRTFGLEVRGLAGRAFPPPAELASRSVDDIRSLGMPESRARSVLELARAVAEDRVDLVGPADPEEAAADLQAIRGIGPWTAAYILMRACRWPDAFPESDLGIRKALGGVTAGEAEKRSSPWRPWRAYAALHLWSHLATGDT